MSIHACTPTQTTHRDFRPRSIVISSRAACSGVISTATHRLLIIDGLSLLRILSAIRFVLLAFEPLYMQNNPEASSPFVIRSCTSVRIKTSLARRVFRITIFWIKHIIVIDSAESACSSSLLFAIQDYSYPISVNIHIIKARFLIFEIYGE
jgi:hypothetical protein